MILSVFKKILSVFLILTHSLQTVLWALPNTPYTFHVTLKENSVHDFSFEVKAQNTDFSFSDESACSDNDLPFPWQRSVIDKQVTYAFNDHDIFKVDFLDPLNKRLILLGNLSDIVLGIESDWGVVLSTTDRTTKFDGIHIQTCADIFNYGRLKTGSFGFHGICRGLFNQSAVIICEGDFSCTTQQNEIFNNVHATLKARTISVDTGSVLNEKGKLIAHSNFETPIEKNDRLQLITSGIHLTAKRLIDHRYGMLICGMDRATVPCFGFSNPEYKNKKFGLDARSGTIIAKKISLYDNAWPYFLDNSAFHISDCASLHATEIDTSDAPFALLAKDINITTKLFSGHPYFHGHSLTIQMPYASDKPILNFGKKTKIEAHLFTLKSQDQFEPKGLLKGILKVQLLTLEMDVDTSDLTLDARVINLRHEKGRLQDNRLGDKKIEKAYVKVPDVAVFNGHPSLNEIYIYTKKNTGSVAFHDFSLKNGTVSLVDKYDGINLFLSGIINARKVSVDSKKQVRHDGKIGNIDERLSLTADSLSISSSSIILSSGNLNVKALILAPFQFPARVQRNLQGIDLTIEGAGAVFEEPLSFKTLVANAQILGFLKQTTGHKADIRVSNFFVQSCEEEMSSLTLEKDSTIECENGVVINGEINVENGKLSVNVRKSFQMIPGSSTTDKTIKHHRTKIHAKNGLDITIKENAQFESISSELSCHEKVVIKCENGATFKTDTVDDVLTEEKKPECSFVEKNILQSDGGEEAIRTSTPVHTRINAKELEFNQEDDSAFSSLKGCDINGSIPEDQKQALGIKSAYKKTEKKFIRVDGQVLWQHDVGGSSTKKDRVPSKINNKPILKDVDESSFEEKISDTNTSLTPLAKNIITISALVAAVYFIPAAGVVAPFSCAIGHVTSTGCITGINYLIGDKHYADYITSEEFWISLAISTAASYSMKSFGQHLQGKQYSPSKLPGIFKEGTRIICREKLKNHALLLLAHQAEYAVLESCLRGPSSLSSKDFWKGMGRRLLYCELDSCLSHYTDNRSTAYAGGNLSYGQHKIHIAFGAAINESFKTSIRYASSEDRCDKPWLLYLMPILAAGSGAAIGQIAAERNMFGQSRPDLKTKNQITVEDILKDPSIVKKEIQNILELEKKLEASLLKKSILFGKLAACLPGLLMFQAETLSAAYMAGTVTVSESIDCYEKVLRERVKERSESLRAIYEETIKQIKEEHERKIKEEYETQTKEEEERQKQIKEAHERKIKEKYEKKKNFNKFLFRPINSVLINSAFLDYVLDTMPESMLISPPDLTYLDHKLAVVFSNGAYYFNKYYIGQILLVGGGVVCFATAGPGGLVIYVKAVAIGASSSAGIYYAFDRFGIDAYLANSSENFLNDIGFLNGKSEFLKYIPSEVTKLALTVLLSKGIEKTITNYNQAHKIEKKILPLYKIEENLLPNNITQKTNPPLYNTDKWVRDPASIQDQMILNAVKNRYTNGKLIIKSLNDPKFKGMEKWRVKVKSVDGKVTVIHFVIDPKTGNRMDFKFKQRSVD